VPHATVQLQVVAQVLMAEAGVAAKATPTTTSTASNAKFLVFMLLPSMGLALR
jgi:hypothetical protein